MRAIPERLRGVITTRRYTNPRLPYLTSEASFSDTEKVLCSWGVILQDDMFKQLVAYTQVHCSKMWVFLKLCQGYGLCLFLDLWYSVFLYHLGEQIGHVHRPLMSGLSASNRG